MRHLISSLQNHNLQLKGDVQRYKRKLRETQMEINKVGGLRQPAALGVGSGGSGQPGLAPPSPEELPEPMRERWCLRTTGLVLESLRLMCSTPLF